MPIELLYMPCEMPIQGFKAWNEGVVTIITLEIRKNHSKIISGAILETKRVTQLSMPWNTKYSHERFSRKLQNISSEMLWNCSQLNEYLTNNLYNIELELSFPIAYIFAFYDTPQQILCLLKLLYRPQNIYCIHPDKKSVFRYFFIHLFRCFHSITIPIRLMEVMWDNSTIMDAQVSCMSDFISYREKQD